MGNFDINFLRQMSLLGQGFGKPAPIEFGDDQGITTPTDNLANLPSSYPSNLNISGDNPPGLTSGLLNLPPEESDYEKQARMMREQYHPSTSANDRLNALLNQYPHEEKPGLGRTLVAISAGLGHGGVKAGQDILDEPHNKALADWKNQVEPAGRAAEIERQGNVNERYIASQSINSTIAQQRANDARDKAQGTLEESIRKDQANEKIKQAHEDMLKAKELGYTFKVVGNKFIGTAPDGSTFDTGEDATNYTPMKVAEITGKYRVQAANINQAGANQRNEASVASREIYNIPDPSDPTKQIAVRVNPVTNKVERVKLDDQDVGPVGKPLSGSGSTTNDPNALTTQTKNMMQGAKMMLPIVTEVGKQAADLEQRNLFGPVMSRVRNAAAKIGTTGNPAEVQKSLEEFSAALQDPSFNPGDDFAVGNFLASLGFLASGAARVHSRTGGSMGMITYMKSLLTSESSLNMFNGKLTAIQKLLTDYATGPGGSAVIQKKPVGLDEALDNIFGKAPVKK